MQLQLFPVPHQTDRTPASAVHCPPGVPLCYVAAIKPGLVKIGYVRTAGNLVYRMKQIGGRLLAVVPGGEATERRLHRQFSWERLGPTECFEHSAAIAAFVSSCNAGRAP